MPRPPASHQPASQLGRPAPVPTPLKDHGRPPQVVDPLARAPGHPPAPPRCRDPRRPGEVTGGHPNPPLRGIARAPPPLLAPEARDGVHAFLRTQEVTAITGVHLVRLLAATPRQPPRAQAPRPDPDLELWGSVWIEWLARLPPECR